MRLPAEYRDQIISQANAELPNECCGLIGGRDDVAQKLYPIANSDASPYRYNMDSKELLRAMREIDDNEWELMVIYHSHTHTDAYPSATDVSLAFYPDAHYLLVSLQNDDAVIRSFRIVDQKVTEEPVEFA